MAKTCKTCAHYKDTLPDDKQQGVLSVSDDITGQCRYEPPELIVFATRTVSMFKRVNKDWTCGQHKSK